MISVGIAVAAAIADIALLSLKGAAFEQSISFITCVRCGSRKPSNSLHVRLLERAVKRVSGSDIAH